MGKMQRDKGKRGERATATELREAFPELADGIHRGWQSRKAEDDPDVVVPGLNCWFEVKTGKQPNPRAALKQAIEESGTRLLDKLEVPTPIAVIRDDRKEPFAVMRWVDLIWLLRAARMRKDKAWFARPLQVRQQSIKAIRDELKKHEPCGCAFCDFPPWEDILTMLEEPCPIKEEEAPCEP